MAKEKTTTQNFIDILIYFIVSLQKHQLKGSKQYRNMLENITGPSVTPSVAFQLIEKDFSVNTEY